MFANDPPDSELTGPLLSIGRYQVTDRLGGGGMGVVYLARDPTLERFVAIKLIRQGFDEPELRERFVREARAVASLRHPCIVTVFEYGDHGGRPFIVMEHVSGKTLRDIIHSRAPMSLARQLQLVEDLCRGLSHAHRAGIVHRDVKPANIMVDAEGTLKILDFGIAKVGQAGITDINGLVGTPSYMSPEQVAGRPATRRSDIFSVGLVFFEILAYKPAFHGGNQFDVMRAILNDDAPPLSELVAGLDPRIIRIVDKALQKDPDRRYQDLAQMRREVERLRLELAVAAHTTQLMERRPSPPQVQLEELARRRGQQIGANLENAERAFELGDYDAALSASEDALILDPHDQRAFESLQRAQAAIVERDAMTHLKSARQHFEKDELTLAEGRLRAAFELAPALMEGFDLKQQVDSARERRAHRAQAMKLALDRAKIRVGEGAYESAIHAADEVLEYNPSDSAALRLKAEAVAALEDQRRRQEVERRVQSAIVEARRLATRDRFDEAWVVLEEPALAAHPAIREARRRIETDRAEFEQLKIDAAARAEADRQRAEAVAQAEQDRLWAMARAAEERQHAEAAAMAEREAAASAEEERQRFEAAARTRETVRPSGSDASSDVNDQTVVLPAFSAGMPSDGPAVQTSSSSLAESTISPPLPSAAVPQSDHLSPTAGFVARPAIDSTQPIARPGAREWFSDNLFVEAKIGHQRMAFGMSLTTHVVSFAALLLALLVRPGTAPAVRELAPVFLAPAEAVPPPSGPRSAAPTKAAPVRTTAAAPIEAPESLPPIELPPAPPVPTPPDFSTLGTSAPVDGGRGLPIPGGSAPGVDGGINETPVKDPDSDAALLSRIVPRNIQTDMPITIRVEVTVDSAGHVSNAKIVDRGPYDSQILEAVQGALFKPARKRGRPVATIVVLRITLNPR